MNTVIFEELSERGHGDVTEKARSRLPYFTAKTTSHPSSGSDAGGFLIAQLVGAGVNLTTTCDLLGMHTKIQLEPR